MAERRHVLIAPLDWGLGHATRCVPIVRKLIEKGHVVSIATSGQALILLKKEFPGLAVFEIPGYAPVYSRWLPLHMGLFLQLPVFLRAIIREHRAVTEIVKREAIDVIISDNRYGCWVRQHPSVIITHQINIMMPRLLMWFAPVMRWGNRRLRARFQHTWIPDSTSNSYTGKLSHYANTRDKFVGTLSRFRLRPNREFKYDIVVLISGPEQQRSSFEKIVLKQLNLRNERILLIRGLPDGSDQLDANENITVVNHLNGDELGEVLCSAQVIIARSGYSTIMDLIQTGGNAIFVPTPGQTEQEYLARRMEKLKIAYFQNQHEFDLERSLTRYQSYRGFDALPVPDDLLSTAIDELLS